MLSPAEIRVDDGRILLGPRSMLPCYRRDASPPVMLLPKLFRDEGAVMRLRALWAQLGLGGDHTQHLTPLQLHRALERALATHRLAILWVPQHTDRPLVFAVPPAKVVAPPSPGPAAAPGTVRPPLPAVRPAFDTLDPIDRVELALKKSFGYVKQDLKAEIAKLDAEVILRGVAAFCMIVAIAQAGGPVAAALDAALLAYGYYLLGWNGLQAALAFGTACFEAVNAKGYADIEVAARHYADAFDHLGQAFIAWLLIRVQTRGTGAARGVKSSEEAAVTSGEQAGSARTVAGDRVRANAARGAASEARILNDLGLEKNYQAVYTAEGRAIPDALTDTLSVEIKDTSYVSLTQQLRIETEAARVAGRESVLITGEKTIISGPASRAFDTIIRRPDLGPQ